MRNVNRSLAALTAALTMLASSVASTLQVQAKPAFDIKESQSLLKNNDEFYSQARAELPEDYYLLYRLIERISRANGLDDRPWRVIAIQEYDINAFAADVNLLAFYSGLMDQIHGDPNALACVVGHEMAHHTEEHIAFSAAQREIRLQELRQEAVDEVAAEEDDLSGDLQEMAAGEWAAGNAGSLVDQFAGTGGLGGALGGFISGQIRNSRQRRLRKAAERIEEIYAEKEATFLAEETERSHSHEFEADEIGYQYMVRAGFQPGGCITVMEALNRIPGSQTAGITHPSTPDRIAALEQMSVTYPTATLQSEGNANIASNPTALTYDLSRDGGSLRINSQSGSRDIDELLPQ